MNNRKSRPWYIRASLSLCRFFSHSFAVLHYAGASMLLLKIPADISRAPEGVYKNLQKIWSARLLKKLVSVWLVSPFRRQALNLITLDFRIPCETGLVIVTCHTPWKRLIRQWLFENHYALLIDTGNSIKRKNRLKDKRKGYNELNHIVRHLQLGGHIIIAADVFDKSNNYSTEILGKAGNLSLLPSRLARIAGVPMLAVVPQLRNDAIHLYAGPKFSASLPTSESGKIMQGMLGYFENEIKKDPSIWSYFVNEPLSGFHKKRIV